MKAGGEFEELSKPPEQHGELRHYKLGHTEMPLDRNYPQSVQVT